MKTDDYVERERKRMIARLDNLENAQIGKDNVLLTWVMLYGREPVSDLIVGRENVDRINKLREAGYLTTEWKPSRTTVFDMQYVLTTKARQRLNYLSKQQNRSSKK
jgi:hypothetical protein